MIPTKREIEEKDSVRFFHPDHDKPRTGVVIRIQAERLLVIFGRGSLLDPHHVFVPHPSQEAAALDLNKPTYFYAKSVVIVRRAIADRVGHCPPSLVGPLRLLAQEGVRYARTLA